MLITSSPLAPEATVIPELDLEDTSAPLDEVLKACLQLQGPLDLHDCTKPALIISQIERSIQWVSLNESMQSAHADITHS